jgi:transposase
MNDIKLAPGAIVEKKRGKRRYYYYQRAYRVKIAPQAQGRYKGSGKSKVINEQIYLGTAEAVRDKIRQGIDHPRPQEIDKKIFGLPMALFEVAERVGLRKIINELVPGKIQGIRIGDFVLIAALNRVGHHSSKEQMGRWYRKTALGQLQGIDPSKLNSKNFWYAFDQLISEKQVKERKAARGFAPNDKIDIDELEEVLDDAKIEAIEGGIWKNLAQRFGFLLDVVLYDTTNFYTFHQLQTPNSLAQFGKSKQHQNDKRLLGLQLGLLRDLGLPIFHNVYCGNAHEATLFPTAIRTLLRRYQQVLKGTGRLVLIFDKGNNSRENIALVESQQIPIDFIGALNPAHHRDLVEIPLSRFDQAVGKFRVHRSTKEVFAAKRTIVITHHEATARRQHQRFEAQMKRVMTEAKAYFDTIAQKPISEIRAHMETFLRTAQAGRFYELRVWHNGWVNRLSLRRNRREVALKKASFGKKILFTTLHTAPTETILDDYKSAHQIEDAFHHIKDRELVPYAPAYHWTDSKIRVHAFVCVIALLLVRLLQHLARQNGIQMSTSLLIEELQDICVLTLLYSPRKVERKIHTLSTVQKRLFDLFELHKYT